MASFLMKIRPVSLKDGMVFYVNDKIKIPWRTAVNASLAFTMDAQPCANVHTGWNFHFNTMEVPRPSWPLKKNTYSINWPDPPHSGQEKQKQTAQKEFAGEFPPGPYLPQREHLSGDPRSAPLPLH